ncbi:hypothetical protein BDY17DRAFT_328015 [Neohortaea acidophila]|uniref:DUF7730 domain-containing protein n=1 Tax=Neohortaea acidophila TaxID=245834 RepID=A0A6A6PGX4_9PEZI|nr:uncharacterized protein BDY17DRAFT_328015 [Neohortaea acidophila]KAF2479239.1 hypothetical protein BDY17DRAFT_328015 [Neohortaea acidophila]
MVDLNIVTGALKGWGGQGLPFGTLLHSSPPRRQRTLTAPLHETAPSSFWQRLPSWSTPEPEQRTNPQTQCALLTTLPLDIRLLIYDMVLGGMAFHIGNDTTGRMTCYICQRAEGIVHDDDHQACLAPTKRRPSASPREDYTQATGLLPLLVTCRQIYSEAIETLYSANTFEFWQNQAALRFLRIMIPPQRLRCIRRFRWAMQFPHHPNINARSRTDWSDLFAFFANETYGLQHLYLKLKRNYLVEAIIQQTPDERAAGWIEPMVLMAIDANRKRKCLVEIAMNGVVHVPVDIFENIQRRHRGAGYREVLDWTCTEMHRRIRLSLDAPG